VETTHAQHHDVNDVSFHIVTNTDFLTPVSIVLLGSKTSAFCSALMTLPGIFP
jgi:hypothetical protein